MSANRNLVIRRGHSNLQSPLVLSVKACPPVSLRVRSPDVAVRSSVHVLPATGVPQVAQVACDSIVASTPTSDQIRVSKKSIKLGPSKVIAQNLINWDHDHTPSDSQILRLAHQKEVSFVLGFSALHWACELLKESVVQTIIEKKLVHPDTIALHDQFISFTPVFSAICVLWLRAEHESGIGVKESDYSQEERSCLSIMKKLAAAGAKLDSEVEVRLDDIKQVTLLHIAADYACLQHGRAFHQRQDFFLQVSRLLADNLTLSEAELLLQRRCKVDGKDAVTVKELIESKNLPPKLKSGCISSLMSIFSHCIDDQSYEASTAPHTHTLKDTSSGSHVQCRKRKIEGVALSNDKKVLGRSRLRSQTESSSNNGLFPISKLAGSELALKIHPVSSCSESDSQSGFASGCDDQPPSTVIDPPHANRSILASNTDFSVRPISSYDYSQDCEAFLASCDRIHIQCKLGCIPGVGVLSASSSSKCSSEVSCPLCGVPVYANVLNPMAVTVQDMQASVSLHVLRDCTAVLCNINGCRWKGGYSHLPLHIATAHTFS